MKWQGNILCAVILLGIAGRHFLQAQEVPVTTEQQLENQTLSEEGETEDDAWLQDMEQFRKHPVNINTADAEELQQLRILTALQIASLLAYRNLFGPLVHIYELQAVPSWDLGTIRKLLPFLISGNKLLMKAEAGKRFREGDHSLLLRLSLVLEKAKGFENRSGASGYLGSPLRIFFRYRYHYKNLLQFGLLGDKDAGEPFFRGAQNKGFDFYSFHLFARKWGAIESLAVGDFTVNMGQGLIQWQSLAFKKSADVLNSKRQSAVLRPYSSPAEFNFHRGAGVTLKKGKYTITVFASVRKLSANLVADTISNRDYITSFLQSGYHRTPAEIADRNKLKQTAVGTTVLYRSGRWHAALNGIHYNFSIPVQKRPEPYNLYAISGKTWSNFSVDYSYTYRNLHFFGEAATDKNFHPAFINGLLLSADPAVDVSIVHRSISKAYQSVNGNAFTESSYPTNETGWYMGVAIRPAVGWRLDAYADFFRFPWLRYLSDAPGRGTDYMVQLSYSPHKQLDMHTRFRNETKQANDAANNTSSNYLVSTPRQSWRTQIDYRLHTSLQFRSRVEIIWYGRKGAAKEQGFLHFMDMIYRPALKPFSLALRLQYFETAGFNSRIYAYENDVLYSFSIPAFFDKGVRYYLVINYNLGKNLGFWLRWAQTLYPGKETLGSGLDEIRGSRKTEIRWQARWSF